VSQWHKVCAVPALASKGLPPNEKKGSRKRGGKTKSILATFRMCSDFFNKWTKIILFLNEAIFFFIMAQM
jgi:hypothetical protein